MNRRGGASSGGSTPTANPRPAAKGGAAIQAGSLRDERERRLAVEEELHESEAVRLRQRAEVQPMIEELAIAVDELERGGQLQLALEQESQQSFEFLADSIQDIKKTAAARLDELAVGWAADVENIHTQLKRLAQAALEEQQRSAMRLRVQRKDVEIARGEMQAIREGLEERVASQAVLIEHQRVSMDEQLEAAARERCELRSQIATLEEGVYTLDGEQMKLRVQMASVAARASRGVVLGGSGGDSGGGGGDGAPPMHGGKMRAWEVEAELKALQVEVQCVRETHIAMRTDCRRHAEQASAKNVRLSQRFEEHEARTKTEQARVSTIVKHVPAQLKEQIEGEIVLVRRFVEKCHAEAMNGEARGGAAPECVTNELSQLQASIRGARIDADEAMSIARRAQNTAQSTERLCVTRDLREVTVQGLSNEQSRREKGERGGGGEGGEGGDEGPGKEPHSSPTNTPGSAFFGQQAS
jgi:hypothetical protein